MPSWTKLVLLPWTWRQYVLPKSLVLSDLNGVTSQNTVMFCVLYTAVCSWLYCSWLRTLDALLSVLFWFLFMNLAFSSEMSLCSGRIVASILIRPQILVQTRQTSCTRCKVSDFWWKPTELLRTTVTSYFHRNVSTVAAAQLLFNGSE